MTHPHRLNFWYSFPAFRLFFPSPSPFSFCFATQASIYTVFKLYCVSVRGKLTLYCTQGYGRSWFAAEIVCFYYKLAGSFKLIV